MAFSVREISGELFDVREKESTERESKAGVARGGWGWLGLARQELGEREREQRLRASRIWKMVYEKKFRKPFS